MFICAANGNRLILLFQEWLRSGKRDNTARDMFDEAALDIEQHLIQTSASGLTYIGKMSCLKTSFNIKYKRLTSLISMTKIFFCVIIFICNKIAKNDRPLRFGGRDLKYCFDYWGKIH